MARFDNVNNTFSTGGAVNYALKEVMKLAGWVVKASSDGTTYNSTGDQITSGSSGAGGFNNNGAWVRLQDPGAVREVVIQCNGVGTTGSNNTRILYSAASKFTGGTPGAVRVPTATDQQFVFGGGTDASPTYSLWTSNTSVRLHIIAESTPISGVYPVSMVGTQLTSTNQSGACFIMEPMMPGSFLSDNDPCVIGYTSSTTITWMGWLGYGTGSATWVASLTANNAPYDGTCGPDLTAGNDTNGYAEISGTAAAAKRVKGICTRTAFKGPARNYPSTANRATDARLYWGSYVVLYKNNTEPSVA